MQKFWRDVTDGISVPVLDQSRSSGQAFSKSGTLSSNMITPEEECLLHLMNFKCAACL